MPTEERLQTALRETQRLKKLGNSPSCVLCGVANPEALTRCKKSLLESHHIAGRSNDSELTVVLCLNCHRIATERQRRCGVELCHREKSAVERFINLLIGIGSALILIGETLIEYAKQITTGNLKLATD